MKYIVYKIENGQVIDFELIQESEKQDLIDSCTHKSYHYEFKQYNPKGN